jgi:hypothetical protein
MEILRCDGIDDPLIIGNDDSFGVGGIGWENQAER